MIGPVIVATAASWYLCGLSWTIGLVVYPSFAQVGVNDWQGFHLAHTRTITWAVGPMWAIQAAAIGWWLLNPPSKSTALAVLTAGFAGIAVLITVFLAVPAHNKLSSHYDPGVARALLRSHHARSIVWTAGAITSSIAMAVVT